MGAGTDNAVEIRCRDEIGQAPFVMLNDWVLWDKGISDGARATYCALIRFARQDGVCFPGQSRLAAGRGLTERALRDQLKELEARGLISIERRGKGLTNRYWIEPLQTVYGSEENQWKPSEAAKQQCWSPIGSRAEAAPSSNGDWAERQKAAIEKNLSAGAALLQQATAQSKEAADERMVALERKRSQRVKQKMAKREPSTKTKLRRVWDAAFEGAFPGRTCPKWETADHVCITKLVEAYGIETTMTAMELLCSQWEARYQVIFKATGNPNLRILWGFRDTIFPEVETGKRLDPKSRRLRDDEYQPGTTIRSGQW